MYIYIYIYIHIYIYIYIYSIKCKFKFDLVYFRHISRGIYALGFVTEHISLILALNSPPNSFLC